MSIKKALYTTTATATGGHKDRVVTTDNQLISLPVSSPGGLGGDSSKVNAEQLFALGYAACFHDAVGYFTKKAGYDMTGLSVEVRNEVGYRKEGSGFGFDVQIDVNLPNVPADQVATILREAEHTCPFSNSIRGNAQVTVKSNGEVLSFDD